MSKLKILSGVAYSIGHHAQSGLSYLYPHLGHACQQAGVLTAEVDLLSDRPYPVGLPERKPLQLALLALQQTFITILEKHGFALSDITAARLEFAFPPGYGDGSLYRVKSTVVAQGRTFERFLPMIGEHT